MGKHKKTHKHRHHHHHHHHHKRIRHDVVCLILDEWNDDDDFIKETSKMTIESVDDGVVVPTGDKETLPDSDKNSDDHSTGVGDEGKRTDRIADGIGQVFSFDQCSEVLDFEESE